MGNFSISHYAAIRVLATSIEVRYVLDLAEIPTFQEIQDSGIVAEAAHASVGPYLARKAETLGSGRAALAMLHKVWPGPTGPISPGLAAGAGVGA